MVYTTHPVWGYIPNPLVTYGITKNDIFKKTVGNRESVPLEGASASIERAGGFFMRGFKTMTMIGTVAVRHKTRSEPLMLTGIFNPQSFIDQIRYHQDRPSREAAESKVKQHQETATLSGTVIQIPFIPNNVDLRLMKELPNMGRYDVQALRKKAAQDGDWVNKGDLVAIDSPFFKMISPVSGRVLSNCAKLQGNQLDQVEPLEALETTYSVGVMIRPETGSSLKISWKDCLEYRKGFMKDIRKMDDDRVRAFLNVFDKASLPNVPVSEFVAPRYLDGSTHPAQTYMENEPT